MIKGVKKDVVLLKNTGSRVFEEAYFILREPPGSQAPSDLAEEARRIIASNVLSPEKAFPDGGRQRKMRLRCLLFLAAGTVLGAAAAAIVFLALL